MKILNYSAYPFFRLLIPLLLGRVFSLFITPDLLGYGITSLIVIASLVLIFYLKGLAYSKRWWLGVFVFAAVFMLGLLNKPNYYFSEEAYNDEIVYKSIVKSVVKDTDQKQTLLFESYTKSGDQTLFFKTLAYIQKDSLQQGFKPGDALWFKSSLKPFNYTRNPYAFEYADYMYFQDVKGQFFIKYQELIKEGIEWNWIRPFYIFRQQSELKLKKLPLNKEEYAIVTALLLGDKSKLDYQTKANFSGAGAIHILSVSGLHVGIIFLLLSSLFGKMKRGLSGLLKCSAIILILWTYAAVAGMAPSVFRATIMFTVFLISRVINHQYKIYHSLVIAAFVILIIDPYSFFNAGFWLSFSAVASIVYFYPQINSWFYFSSPWGKFIWALVSVSLSVQIGTLPLGLYLFRFFPTWFILSNILIVPVLPFVLFGALVIILNPEIPFIFNIIAESLSSLILYINEVTTWISHLPWARFTAIQLEFYQLFILYLALFMFVYWQLSKRGKYLLNFLALMSLAIIAVSLETYKKYNQTIFTVHQIKNASTISFVQKERSIFWFNDSIETKAFDYAIEPLFLQQETGSVIAHSMDEEHIIGLKIGDYKVLILNGKVESEDFFNEVDIAVLTNKVPRKYIESLINSKLKVQLVFDSSFSRNRSLYWQKRAKKDQQSICFVALQGAFSIHKTL